jgi:hypothetical protein
MDIRMKSTKLLTKRLKLLNWPQKLVLSKYKGDQLLKGSGNNNLLYYLGRIYTSMNLKMRFIHHHTSI